MQLFCLKIPPPTFLLVVSVIMSTSIVQYTFACIVCQHGTAKFEGLLGNFVCEIRAVIQRRSK